MQDGDVRGLARGAVDLFRSAATTHRLVLDVTDEPAMVSCDSLRIEQVLNNLISNAIKYSPSGSDVNVDVGVRDDEAVLSVRDEGVGIAPEDVPHIFEPFRRTGASRESVKGVGLGLYVTKRIVEAHGGRLEVDSMLGAGSTFRVFLPLSRVARHEPVAQRPRPEPPGASL
jgi:signal transduction histidine kinase